MTHLITLACLLVAAGLYALGLSTGAVSFVGLGMLAEGAFWIRLLRRAPRPAPRARLPVPADNRSAARGIREGLRQRRVIRPIPHILAR